MGDSMPPPATFDLVDSFARRRGEDVEIVLGQPKTDITGSDISVRLKQGRRSVEATARLDEAGTGTRLTVTAPRGAFVDGVWTLEMNPESEEAQQLAARLLVQGDRPLVLLWGAKAGRTSLPRGNSPAATRKRQAAQVGGRALDRALSVLPEPKARALRSRARSTARRLLG
jgi:hypothetical protein